MNNPNCICSNNGDAMFCPVHDPRVAEAQEMFARNKTTLEKQYLDSVLAASREAIANIATWFEKHAFREYLALPRNGQPLAFPKFVSGELRKFASGEREIPGDAG